MVLRLTWAHHLPTPSLQRKHKYNLCLTRTDPARQLRAMSSPASVKKKVVATFTIDKSDLAAVRARAETILGKRSFSKHVCMVLRNYGS